MPSVFSIAGPVYEAWIFTCISLPLLLGLEVSEACSVLVADGRAPPTLLGRGGSSTWSYSADDVV